MASIVIIGPAHPLRGGLATFDERLCRQFLRDGHHCCIYSFSLQYPSILFPGTTQYSTDPPPSGLEIHSVINSVNPLNWQYVGNRLKKLRPDIILVRYWLPFMGLALGTILRKVRKNKHTKIIAITDNVIPHEKRPGDKPFTSYFLTSCDAFVTMSDKVMKDLRSFEPVKPAKQLMHPLYDSFGTPVLKEEARKVLGINDADKVILFFGFIRKYKGLDLLLEAMKILKESTPGSKTPRLLIAGEFYEDRKYYDALMADLKDDLILHTDFIPDSKVKYYLCAADVVVQPYRNATQSGVTPLAYHFERPMIVTNVGGLPALVPHERAGLVCEPTPSGIATAISTYFQLGEHYFIPHLREEKQKYSWDVFVKEILSLASGLPNKDLAKT